MITEIRKPESVFCACGAQWHGQYTSSSVIADHQARQATGKRGCGVISHEAFAGRFTCMCPVHKAERSAAWRARRGRQ